MSSHAPALTTPFDDFLAIPAAERRHEIVDGELVPKAMPSGPHGRAQFRLGVEVGGPYDRRAGRGGPGGWIFANEVEIRFEAANVFRPDVAGWRRERVTRLPLETPLEVRPDWICEILSPSNKQNDLFKKLRVYQRCQVGYSWIIAPDAEVLAVYRWTPDGYLLIVTAVSQERFHAEPFEAVELSVHELLGGDEDSPPPGQASPVEP